MGAISVKYLAKSDVVTEALRELVITGQLAPGAELRQRDLALRFNVSATPIREALKRLESEGLVLHDVHRGARVIDTAFEAGEENFLIRASLEGLTAALAAGRATDDDVADLERLNDALAGVDERDDEAGALNRQFHFRLFEVAGSPLLLSLLRLLWHSFQQGEVIVRPLATSIEQHRGIIEALRDHDPVRAELLTRAHILEGRGLDAGVLPPPFNAADLAPAPAT
jgi:DNA-binding GntR family transcriptional regulator